MLQTFLKFFSFQFSFSFFFMFQTIPRTLFQCFATNYLFSKILIEFCYIFATIYEFLCSISFKFWFLFKFICIISQYEIYFICLLALRVIKGISFVRAVELRWWTTHALAGIDYPAAIKENQSRKEEKYIYKKLSGREIDRKETNLWSPEIS